VTKFTSSSGIVVSYDFKKKDVILNSFQSLVEELTHPNLWIGFQCSYPLHNLAYLLKVDEFDESLKRTLLFKLIHKNQILQSASFDGFLELFCQEIHQYNLQKQLEFNILYTINISEGVIPVASKLRINGTVLEFYAWDRIKKEYDIESLIQKNNLITGSKCQLDKLALYTAPIICQVHGKNPNSAFSRVEENIELFRSVLNYFIDHQLKIQLGPPEPLAIVRKTGYYGVFSNNGELLDNYVDIPIAELHDNHEPKLFSINEMTKLLRRLEKKKPMSNTLMSALSQYCSALDSTDNSTVFLYLWQCLESITMLAETQYSMADVVERAQCLIKSKDIELRQFLQLCSDRRNKFVHKGKFNINSESDVQLLKMLVKFSLAKFIRLTEQFQEYKEMELYYKFSKYDQKELKTIKMVIQTMEEENIKPQ
jgi:hypothetical protein